VRTAEPGEIAELRMLVDAIVAKAEANSLQPRT